MTTQFETERRCSVCGTVNKVWFIGSYSSMGTMMTGAPRFMGFSPLSCEIQHCSHCDYCARDLSDPLELPRSILESEGYRTALRRDGEHGALAYLLSQIGDHRGAAMMYLRGAWNEDEARVNEVEDIRFRDGELEMGPLPYEERKTRRELNLIHHLTARRLRTLAISEFLKTGPRMPEDRWIMADMLRCTGRLDEARGQVEKLLDDPRCHEFWPTGELERILINDRMETPRIMNRSASRASKSVFWMQADSDGPTMLSSTITHVYLSRGFRTSGIGVDDYVVFEDSGPLSGEYFLVSGIKIVYGSDPPHTTPVHFVDESLHPHPGKSSIDCPVVLELSPARLSDDW